MSGKDGQGGERVEYIVNNRLEDILVHQFHRQVVLNQKAKNSEGIPRSPPRSAEPQVHQYADKNYIGMNYT